MKKKRTVVWIEQSDAQPEQAPRPKPGTEEWLDLESWAAYNPKSLVFLRGLTGTFLICLMFVLFVVCCLAAAWTINSMLLSFTEAVLGSASAFLFAIIALHLAVSWVYKANGEIWERVKAFRMRRPWRKNSCPRCGASREPDERPGRRVSVWHSLTWTCESCGLFVVDGESPASFYEFDLIYGETAQAIFVKHPSA